MSRLLGPRYKKESNTVKGQIVDLRVQSVPFSLSVHTSSLVQSTLLYHLLDRVHFLVIIYFTEKYIHLKN